ncbi:MULTISPECIES: allene oxide cyclase barrel-like domain-containing protein [Streptomyces]|uniref:allene oxide cyclase barrel-like domain-containing protein n=1 Tax=Streptomyces TaxID=1883 RepID=UPI0033B6B24A
MSAVVFSAPLASAAGASSLAGGQQGEQVLSLVAKTTQLTPNGPGNAQGNGFTLADDLYRDGQRVGSGGGGCTIVRLEARTRTGTLQCLISFALSDGDLTVQGFAPYAPPPRDFTLAINGGTGSYAASRGYVHGHTVDGTTTQLTFHIVRRHPAVPHHPRPQRG